MADVRVVDIFRFFFFLMIRRPPRSTQSRSSAASDVYKRQLINRRAIRFPPFYRLISILFQGANAKIVAERAKRFGNIIRIAKNQMRLNQIAILGPAPSPIEKLGGNYRRRLLIRGDKTPPMQRLLRAALDQYHELKLQSGFRIVIDVDPQDLL